MHTVGKRNEAVRFSFSEDVMMSLIDNFDRRFPGVLPPPIPSLPGYDRFTGLRLLLEPPPDPSIPALMVQIEPPSYTPRGHKIWRIDHRFMVQAQTRDVGLDDGLYASRLDYEFLPDALMLVLFFDPTDLRYEGPVKDARQAFGLTT